MKIRHKDNPEEVGFASLFNPNLFGEMFVNFTFQNYSDDIYKYEFYVESLGEWVDSERLFDRKERLTIVDKYNTRFFEPENEADKKRGYLL